jgi:F0F1-type ATP synthase membrane subunit b/b'
MALNPLTQINLVTIGAVIVIFLVTLFLLRRICLVPLIAVMERRAARIVAARALAVEADALLVSAHREADAARAAATAEATQLVERVREEIAAIRGQRLGQARAEAEAILAKGREESRTLLQAEDARLTDELSSCVSAALRKMIGPVEGAAVRFMVKRVLAEKESG